jgi:hypothetical protein
VFFDKHSQGILGINIGNIHASIHASSASYIVKYWNNLACCNVHNILQRQANTPCFTMETTSVILGHIGFLSILNWSFVKRSPLHLLWPILYHEETLRSLLKPLLNWLLIPKILSNQIWITSYIGQPLTDPCFTIFSFDFLCNSLKS